MSRRADPPIHGLLNIDKAPGFTSHDVVAVVRGITGIRRVGHAGTLDPSASGVLPVCIGRATRLADFISEGTKAYRAEIELGARTTTDDADGEVIQRGPVPPMSVGAIEVGLAAFRGEIMQRPPAYSAVSVGGQRAYAAARRGTALELAERPVTVHAIEVVSWESPVLDVRIECSRGTYIRSIARDLGEQLGCGGHIRSLRRTRVGRFRIEEAVSLDALRAAGVSWTRYLLPPDAALDGLCAVAGDRDSMVHGRPFGEPGAATDGERFRVYDCDSRFLGLAVARGGQWWPRVSFVEAEVESEQG